MNSAEEKAVERRIAGIRNHHGRQVVQLEGTIRSLRQYVARLEGTRTNPWHLTGREIDVLQAMANTGDRQAASDRLGLSINTIKTHLSRIAVVMGSTSTLDSVVQALRAGLVK